jgi:molybdate transport system regulatory protein
VARLSIRIDLEPGGRIGPGKIALLEQVAATGSISAAARAMRMSYRRAWLLVEALNGLFREPVVATQTGGSHGGGASLTPFGRELVAAYRAVEREAHELAAARLAALESAAAAERGEPPPLSPSPP